MVYNCNSSWTLPSSCPTSLTAPATGSTDNGNVMGYWYDDNTNTSECHSAAYTYDTVNRLTGAVATPCPSGTANYNLSFGYTADGSSGQYGNMTCLTQGAPACPIVSFNAATNHISTTGYIYDAAGNMQEDSSNPTVHNYQWDAEGRVSVVDPGSSPTWTFTYNALGQRVLWAYSGGANQLLFDPEGTLLGIAGQYPG